MLYLFIVSSLLVLVLQAIHLFQYFFYDSCQIGISPVLCYSLRHPIASCMVSFAALQVSMVVERGIALWKRRHYEKYGPTLGIVLTVLCVLIALATISVVTGGITQSRPTSYCIINGLATPRNIMIMKLIICAVDILTLIGIASLFLLTNYFSKRKSYDLKSSYQLSESTSVIRMIVPLAVSQTLFYISFTISGAIVSLLSEDLDRTLYVTLTSATYTIPYYTVMSPILVWFTIRWSRQLKETKLKKLASSTTNEDNIYFKTYDEMWGRPQYREQLRRVISSITMQSLSAKFHSVGI
ncbi:integral membrane protein, partial [Ostertagia ostertagi]